jgi:hypothetical protein
MNIRDEYLALKQLLKETESNTSKGLKFEIEEKIRNKENSID